MNPINITSKPIPARLFAVFVVSVMALAFLSQSTELNVASGQSPPDSILGKVTNGTTGGELPEDLQVILMSIDLGNNSIIEQETTIIDEDGIFRFNNTVSRPGLSFRVVVNHGSFTPSVDMGNVDNWQDVRINIYDETTSLEDITLSSYTMMVPTIDARRRQVGVLTVINVNNTGDQIWVPDLTDPNLTGLDLLRFNLPEGFKDLAIESELPTGNILEINTGFALTNPIPPGESAILISYVIPYKGDGFDFNLKLPYGAGQVRMLIPDGGGEIRAEGFGDPESLVVAENIFNQFEGANYAAGSEILTSFSGLPQPTPLQQLSDFFKGRTYVIVIMWVVGLALLGILGYAMYSSRKKTDMSIDNDDEQMNRDDVIAKIVDLDEEYQAGKIDEDEYNEQRDELKRLVLEFNETSRLDDGASDETEPNAGTGDQDPAESSDDEDNKPADSDK